MTELGGDNGLYYDDLRIGQRFTSKTHVVDEEQIKAFPAYQPICPPCRRALFLLCSLCWMRGA